MITLLHSDLPTFKTLRFRSGLSIVLSEKSPGATNQQSRNGAGKSSAIAIVHFLLGGNATPKSVFRNPPLSGVEFSTEITLFDRTVTVMRSGETHGTIFLSEAGKDWPVQPKHDAERGDWQMPLAKWRQLLGQAYFDLPIDTAPKYSPTFRSLFSYFVRSVSSGGFVDPLKQSGKQQNWDSQVAISHLLGLDTNLPRRFEQLRDRRKLLDSIRKAAKGGHLANYVRSAADLRTEVAVSDARLGILRERVSTFRVVAAYRETEERASELTTLISILNGENSSDRVLIENIEETLAAEITGSVENVERMYQQAGIVLPDLVQKRFSDVLAFHKTVIANRRQHLGSQKRDALERIGEREKKRDAFDAERQKLMRVLQSGGALEHFDEMRSQVSSLEAEVGLLRGQLEAAEMLEDQTVKIAAERARLLELLQLDYQERASAIARAVVAYSDISKRLYGVAGKLTITPTEAGPKFVTELPSDDSKGINNMKIFCFDLMIMDLCASRGMGPGFLIHDSHIFDGVDERQVAQALELGAQHAADHGYQYIVTMNSDALPSDGFSPDFDIKPFLSKVRLSDASGGGLYGIRFG